MWVIWLLLFSMIVVLSAYAGYCYRLQEENKKLPSFSPDYLAGINFIINDETDKAVDHFIKMLAVDSDTVETHLALGKLFRRRGEVDRAIRIHQNLIARPTLDSEYRDQSFFALGCDYLSAGMLDRAERIFLELLKEKKLMEPASHMLLDIYQQEKAWIKAIDIAKERGLLLKEDQGNMIAHFYCELSEQALQRRDTATALHYLDQANAIDAFAVRPSILRASILMQQHQYKEALQYLIKIGDKDPRFLSDILPMIVTAHDMLHQHEELQAYLHTVAERYPSSGILTVTALVLQKAQGEAVASAFVKDFVRKHPTIAGVVLYLQLTTVSLQGQTRDDLFLLLTIMKKMLAKMAKYQCMSCGFSGNTLHWLCPGCKQWGSVLPLSSTNEKVVQ